MQGLVFLLDIRGEDLGIVAPGVVASACDTLADDDPGVVVAEDTCVLLVALGV